MVLGRDKMMNEPALNPYVELELFNRIQSLERKNLRTHRLTRISFILNGCLLAFLLCEWMGLLAVPRKAIYAESFVVKDMDGNIKAELCSDGETTKLAMYDWNVIPRIAISLADHEPGFHLYDPVGMRRAVLGIARDDAKLLFMNPYGIPQHDLMQLITKG